MKILVVEALGLNVGYLGCYGNDWVATPNLDRLAADGAVFDWHFANQPELQPVTPWNKRSVGTGHYLPPTVPMTTVQPHVVRCENLASFGADALAALTDAPWQWLEGPSLVPPWRLEDELLDAYFDEDDVEEGLTPWPDPPLDVVQLNEAEVLQLQNTYAAAVTVFDAQLGVLLDRVSLDDMLLCVTSRSGLPLGEHGMIGVPRPLLHDELIHVPLVMRIPGMASLRIPALTQPVDLLSTFLEALGHAPPPTHGQSLWPLLRSEAEAIRPYAFASLGESRLLRTPDRALHLPADGAPQLFVKPEDRWEVNDLYQQQIESAEELEKTLHTFVAAIQDPGSLEYPPLDGSSSG